MQLVTHVQLKPYQRLLVKWFDKYNIKINQLHDSLPKINESLSASV
jgi:hypothetical protein